MDKLELDLYRACKRNRRDVETILTDFDANESAGAGSLYPDYQGFTRKDGSFRAPDVTSFTNSSGVAWVQGIKDINPNTGKPYIDANEGVSLNSEAGKFGYAMWFYFQLPEGTPIPACLDVKQTGSDKNHYSIRCKNLMTKEAYEGALNSLARAALVRAIELSCQPLHFFDSSK